MAKRIKDHDRRKSLGGSDAAAILGVDTYRGPLDVYADKTGDGRVEREQTERMRMGLRMEPFILTLYEQDTGHKVRRNKANVALQHSRYDWLTGHLDATAGRRVVDAKNTEWPPTPQRLAAWRAQMLHYCAVTGYPVADLAVLIGGSRLEVITVEAEPQTVADLIEEEAAFWHDHVVARVPPEDTPDSVRAWQRAKYPTSEDVTLVALEHQLPLLDELREVRAIKKALEQKQTDLENQVRTVMGTATTLLAPGLKVTWKNRRPSVGWQLYAEALEAMVGQLALGTYPLDLDPIEAVGTLKSLYTKDGERVFRVDLIKPKETA